MKMFLQRRVIFQVIRSRYFDLIFFLQDHLRNGLGLMKGPLTFLLEFEGALSPGCKWSWIRAHGTSVCPDPKHRFVSRYLRYHLLFLFMKSLQRHQPTPQVCTPTPSSPSNRRNSSTILRCQRRLTEPRKSDQIRTQTCEYHRAVLYPYSRYYNQLTFHYTYRSL